MITENEKEVLLFLEKLNITYTPVSYTHLDVYKRQALGGIHR